MKNNSYINIFSILLLSIVGTSLMGQKGMINHGNMHIHGKGSLAVHDLTNFSSGQPTLNSTERTADMGTYIFVAGSIWLGANDDNHIDGYTAHLGIGDFILPTGDNQSFRPFGKKGNSSNVEGAYFQVDPSNATTSNPVGGIYPTLPANGPFDITVLSSELLTVSDTEYWDINSAQPTQITLTWNTTSDIQNLTSNSLDRLTIVGWRNGQWEEINSTIDPFNLNTFSSTYGFSTNAFSFNDGSITSASFTPDDYDVITLGALNCKKNQTIAQQSLTNPTICRNNDGSITWSGVDPLINYTINYTFENNSSNTTEQSDASGNLQLANLGAGDYSTVTIDDGLCTRNLNDFVITDDLTLDSDMDGLTDCEEIDAGGEPFNPCFPFALGNLDADCDNDNIRNRNDCAPTNTEALFRYDCDAEILYLDVAFDREPWLSDVAVNYKWYDSDPEATPNISNLLSEDKDPAFPNLEKGFYTFYVTVENVGCPTIGKSNVTVEVENLSTVTDDLYAFDFVRDTSYVLNPIANDNITLDNNRLFIQDPPNDAQVTVNLDGTITFIPRSGFSGEILFTYIVCNLDCIDECNTATVTITIRTPEYEFIPNGFSPNGDGVNDVLEITCLEKYPGSSLTLYNRWGDEVYGSTDYKNDWDGKWNNKILPTGTYYYVLNVRDPQRSDYYGYIYIQH